MSTRSLAAFAVGTAFFALAPPKHTPRLDRPRRGSGGGCVDRPDRRRSTGMVAGRGKRFRRVPSEPRARGRARTPCAAGRLRGGLRGVQLALLLAFTGPPAALGGLASGLALDLAAPLLRR